MCIPTLQLCDSTLSLLRHLFHKMMQTLRFIPASHEKYTPNLGLTAQMVSEKLRTCLLMKKTTPAQQTGNDHGLCAQTQWLAQVQLQMCHSNLPLLHQLYCRGVLPSRRSHLFHLPSGRSSGSLRHDPIQAFSLWKTFQMMCMRL